MQYEYSGVLQISNRLYLKLCSKHINTTLPRILFFREECCSIHNVKNSCDKVLCTLTRPGEIKFPRSRNPIVFRSCCQYWYYKTLQLLLITKYTIDILRHILFILINSYLSKIHWYRLTTYYEIGQNDSYRLLRRHCQPLIADVYYYLVSCVGVNCYVWLFNSIHWITYSIPVGGDVTITLH